MSEFRMNEFLDELGSKARVFLKKGKEFADTAIEKGRDKAREMKLNSQLRDTFAKLGEAFYEQAVNGTDFADKEELLDKVTSIKQTLADLAEKATRAAETAEAGETAEEAAEAVAEAAGEAADTVCEACEQAAEDAAEAMDEVLNND